MEWMSYRLEGLEPDNLLAFLTLLGLMRSLETVRPTHAHRVAWTVESPPVRPVLWSSACLDQAALLTAVAEGIRELAQTYDFGQRKDLNLDPEEAATTLADARSTGGGAEDIWSALTTDAVIARNKRKAEPTPLCMMFGQGHQHFLERLEIVPKLEAPPPRGRGRNKVAVSEDDCLREALFERWERLDGTKSFRWDHREDVRYALSAADPTDSKTKDTTQHGANRLAAIGLATLTVVPQVSKGRARLVALGGSRDSRGRFTFSWPIWRDQISLTSILCLLGHSALHDSSQWSQFGIVEQRTTTRVSNGKFMNVTRAEAASPD